jgi:hypothetical protein
MLNHADILHLGKRLTVLFSALKCETQPERLQLARPLSEKRQNILLLATQTVSFGEETLARRGRKKARRFLKIARYEE